MGLRSHRWVHSRPDVGVLFGAKVFWTAGFLRWALVGYFAAGVAALTNVIQDVLLIIALGSKPLAGDWIYRVASGASFIKFTSLLVVVPIGLLVLANAFSRLVTHRGFMKRWARAQKDFPQTAESPDHSATADRVGRGQRIDVRELGLRAQDQTGYVYRSGVVEYRRSEFRAGAFHPGQPVTGVRGEQTAICLSGGGIRSASVALGALQSMRSAFGGLHGIDRIVSVSGGGYTNGGMQLALTASGMRSLDVSTGRGVLKRPMTSSRPAPSRRIISVATAAISPTALLSGSWRLGSSFAICWPRF